MRRILSVIILSFIISPLLAQENKYQHIDSLIDEKIKISIEKATLYLKTIFSPQIFEQYISFNEEGSYAYYEEQAYRPLLHHAISFELPIIYKLSFDINMGMDKFAGALIVKIDSSGIVIAGSKKQVESYKAYQKLLKGQYKFGYDDVTSFILKNKINDSKISFDCFDSEDVSINKKQAFKYCWYVDTCDKQKNTGKILQYIIDPETGKIRKHYLEEISIEPDITN